MNSTNPYNSRQSLRSILAENPQVITTLSRFGIPLGFGEHTVEHVCREAGVDCATFLEVVNLLTGRFTPGHPADISLSSLLSYLRASHSYFVDYFLPRVRRDLIEALSSDGKSELPMMILKFFDDFVEEVVRHMNMEERDFFSQIDEMLAGHHVSNQLTAHDFALRHQPMDAKLRELKEIFVCHYHGDPQGSADLLNSVLLDIINCGADIADHARVEETLLLPAVRKLEGEMTVPPQANEQEDQKDTLELTAREKEIVAAIAHGLGNKQIADRLCVSVHTVTTHRRNICAKLDIHSTAGLTIYALIHGIINIDDIRP